MTYRTIVFLLTSLSHGGAERHTVTLINHFSKHHRVVVAYVRNTEAILASIERGRLIDMVCLDATGRFDFGALKRLVAITDLHEPDLLICTNLYPLLYAFGARLLSKSKFKIVDIFHSTLVRSRAEQAQMMIYKVLLRYTKLLVFVCENQRKHWAQQGLRLAQSEVIHNGIDLERFEPITSEPQRQQIRSSFGFKEADLVVGILAVMRPEKAHGLLLHAVAANARQGVHWKVLMIGDGPERASIEAQIAALGLGSNVVITGLLSDVRAAVAATDAMALVSTAVETFSIGALEAMSMGKPMIMSDIGGASEQVVDGDSGMLFANGDLNALSAALLSAASHQTLARMGERARQRVVENFSEQKMLARYEALVDSLLLN